MMKGLVIAAAVAVAMVVAAGGVQAADNLIDRWGTLRRVCEGRDPTFLSMAPELDGAVCRMAVTLVTETYITLQVHQLGRGCRIESQGQILRELLAWAGTARDEAPTIEVVLAFLADTGFCR
jgi:hypothetical protein